MTGSISASAEIAGFTLSGIENVKVNLADGTSGTAHTQTLNMANAGAAVVTLSGLAATTKADGLTVNNLAAGSSLALTSATNLDLTANFVTAATSGTADSVSVALNNVSSTAATDTILTVGTGFETMNVSTSGTAASLDDIVFNGTTLNVTGDKNLTVRQALDATLDVINAGTFTGNLSIVTANDASTPDATVSGVDVVDDSVTGGSGNDTIDMSANVANNEISVNAGAGNDTVTVGQVLENASTTTAGDVLNGGTGSDTLAGDVDLFDAGTAGFTGATTLTGVTAFETLSVNGFGAEDNTINASNISADISTVTVASNLDTTNARGLTVNFGTAGAYTVNVGGDAAILDGDTLTVDAGGTGTSDALTIANTNVATGTAQMGADDMNITTTDFETVTLNTGSYSTATAQLANAINVGAANTLVLTGSNGLTTTATTGIITASVINASAMTGALTMNVAAASGLTSILGSANIDTLVGDASSSIDGGAGNDIITGGSGNDTLVGGTGDDSITTNAGNDNVTGGAGNDTITIAGNLTAADTLAGSDGTDTLSIGTAAATLATAANVSGFETLAVTTAGLTTDLSVYATNNAITRLNEVGAAGTYTVTGASAAFTTLAAGTAADTFTFSRAINTATDRLTFIGLTAATTTALTANGEETLELKSSSTGQAVITDITDAALTTLLITGTGGVTVTNALTGTTALATITDSHTGTGTLTLDASNSTTAITFTSGAATGTTTLTTGSGNDIISAGAGILSATAGAGNDSATGGTLNDSIDGGAGNDTINGGDGADSLTGGSGSDSITGGEGIDRIISGGGTDTINLTETTSAVDTVVVSGTGVVNVDTVTGFTVASDLVEVTIGAFTGSIAVTLSTAAGADINAGIAAGAFTTESVAAGATTANTAGTNAIFLSSTAYSTFANAVNGEGTGTYAVTDANFTAATEAVLTVWYDATNAQAVVGAWVDDSTTVEGKLTTADSFVEIVRVGMTSTNYTLANIDALLSAA